MKERIYYVFTTRCHKTTGLLFILFEHYKTISFYYKSKKLSSNEKQIYTLFYTIGQGKFFNLLMRGG